MFNRRFIVTMLMILSAIVAVIAPIAAQDDDAEETTPAARPTLGLRFSSENDAIIVTGVIPDGPADAAGIQIDDVIIAIDSESVDADTILDTLGSYAPGDVVTVTVLREDEEVEVEVTLGEPMINRTRRFEMTFTEQAFLGVGFEPEAEAGAVVAGVQPESAAADAGLEVGDVITSVNGEAVEDGEAVAALIGELEPGDTVTLEVERDGEVLTIEAELGSRMVPEIDPEFEGDLPFDFEFRDRDGLPFEFRGPGGRFEFNMPEGGPFEFRGPDGERFEFRGPEGLPFEFDMPFNNRVRLGVAFINLNADTAAENEVDVTQGALITEVMPDSPAAEAGLQVGDVIVAVDGDVIDEERTLSDRLYAYEPDDTIMLEVLRDGETLEIEATLTGGSPSFIIPELPEEIEIPEGENL